MTWFGREMQSYSKNGTSITYKYDEDGLRTQKVINGVEHNYYYVDGLLRTEEIGDSYIMNYRYDPNGTLVAVSKSNLTDSSSSILFAQTNTRGDVVSLYNSSGDIKVNYVYDSWGKLISATDGNGNALAENSVGALNAIRYRGYVYDSETGLYYLQSRYYDPETGRFLNADDVNYLGMSGSVLGYNAFAYCENNPVDRADGAGLTWRIVSSKISISKLSMIMRNNSKFVSKYYASAGYSYSFKKSNNKYISGILTNYSLLLGNVQLSQRQAEVYVFKTYAQWVSFLNYEFKWLIEILQEELIEKLNIPNGTMKVILEWLFSKGVDKLMEKAENAIEVSLMLPKNTISSMKKIFKYLVQFYYKFLSKRMKYYADIVNSISKKYCNDNYLIVIPYKVEHQQLTYIPNHSTGRMKTVWKANDIYYYK